MAGETRRSYGARAEVSLEAQAKRGRRTEAEVEEAAIAARDKRPDRPCFRCGAAGFCGHDGRVSS